VHEGDVAVEALGDERAQHRHDGGDAAAARDEEDAARPLSGEYEVASADGQPHDEPGTGVSEEVLGDPAAVVQADGQFDQVLTLGVRRRVAPRLPAAVDLDGQVDVLAGAQCRSGSEHRVRFQRQRHAARGVAADGNDLGPGVAQCPGRLDELGVSVDPVGSGQQVDEGGAQHSIAEARLQRLSEHVYTVRSLPPIRQRFLAWLC